MVIVSIVPSANTRLNGVNNKAKDNNEVSDFLIFNLKTPLSNGMCVECSNSG